jgi:hypothetical protein
MDGPQTGTFNDAGRLFAVRQLRVLDTAPEAVFDRFTRVAIAVTGASAAMLSVLDASRQFVKSSIGLPDPWGAGRNLPLSHSFCRSVISSRECLVVNDVCVRPTVEAAQLEHSACGRTSGFPSSRRTGLSSGHSA